MLVVCKIISDINDASLMHMIRLLGPQLEKCIKTRDDHKLLVALLDLDIRNDDELRSLCDEWQLIIAQQDAIAKAQPDDAIVLDRLLALVTDCYIDWFKLKGFNAKDKVAKFLKLLSAYDVQGMATFLTEDNNHQDEGAAFIEKHNSKMLNDEGFLLSDDFL